MRVARQLETVKALINAMLFEDLQAPRKHLKRRADPLEMTLIAFEDDLNIRRALRYLDPDDPHFAEVLSIKDALLIFAFVISGRGEDQRCLQGHLLCTRHRLLFLTDEDLLTSSPSGRDVLQLALTDVERCMVRAPQSFGDLPQASGIEHRSSTDGNFYLDLIVVRGLDTGKIVCLPGAALSEMPSQREQTEQQFPVLIGRIVKALEHGALE
ncbi:hypothetical protein BMF89_21370 [Arthrobacter sp. SRS-W-1-2016]|uniref:hypothetical protein n=1 Tax=Arthrobacter sp. SRS-W-1-2016 TaxID=1930254 RepID=UPI000990EF87|nr:hypothetical protein [Arthrobacter sp. SRS-W-1-2016]OOP59222.1 hypothetical protein BMF89_21370 [Arthrobacter sp. SRS-W-1-2016]